MAGVRFEDVWDIYGEFDFTMRRGQRASAANATPTSLRGGRNPRWDRQQVSVVLHPDPTGVLQGAFKLKVSSEPSPLCFSFFRIPFQPYILLIPSCQLLPFFSQRRELLRGERLYPQVSLRPTTSISPPTSANKGRYNYCLEESKERC
ncbi:unnamed protein product [Arctogadus glacialis]